MRLVGWKSTRGKYERQVRKPRHSSPPPFSGAGWCRVAAAVRGSSRGPGGLLPPLVPHSRLHLPATVVRHTVYHIQHSTELSGSYSVSALRLQIVCNFSNTINYCRPWAMEGSPGDEEAAKDPAARQPQLGRFTAVLAPERNINDTKSLV